MTYATTVTTKGQVTIPHKIRDAYNIAPGQKVEFAGRGGVIEVRPLRDIFYYRGYFKTDKKYNEKEAEKAYIKDIIAGRV
ncbi:MAG: AbrB/MazE/SpoVT family DNA-binding domain-containing protein [bacterium]